MTKNLNPYYEELMDDLSTDSDTRYVEYLKEKDRTLVIDNLIFDIDNLDSYYSCDGCKKRAPEAYCCAGYDVELTRRDLEAIEAVIDDVLEAFPKLARKIKKDGFWDYGDEFERVVRRDDNDDCIFILPKGMGCILHAWAIDTGRDPIDVKPYICSLYPVVVIVIGDEVIISTLNDESKVVLEAGENAESCSLDSGSPERHALAQTELILTRMFGEKIMQRVKEKIFNSGRPPPD